MSKVLIVEDELSIAELEKDYLELSSFEVEIETDGQQGLETVSYTHLDVYKRQVFSKEIIPANQHNIEHHPQESR